MTDKQWFSLRSLNGRVELDIITGSDSPSYGGFDEGISFRPDRAIELGLALFQAGCEASGMGADAEPESTPAS